MEYGINKCTTMIICPETPLFSNEKDPTFYIFYLAGQPILKTDCSIYLGIPFDKSLLLDLLSVH